MVLAPGSVVSGHLYTVLSGSLSSVPSLPGWLGRRLSPPPQRLAQARRKGTVFGRSVRRAEQQLEQWCRKIEMAPDGAQNNTINAAAHVLARDYSPPLDPEEIRCQLEDAALRGRHPLSRARPTIRSGLSSP